MVLLTEEIPFEYAQAHELLGLVSGAFPWGLKCLSAYVLG